MPHLLRKRLFGRLLTCLGYGLSSGLYAPYVSRRCGACVTIPCVPDENSCHWLMGETGTWGEGRGYRQH